MTLLNVITIRFSLVLMQHSFVPENQILQTECLVSSCLPQPCCQMECLSCSTFVSDHEMRLPQLLARAAHRTQGNSYLKVQSITKNTDEQPEQHSKNKESFSALSRTPFSRVQLFHKGSSHVTLEFHYIDMKD